MSVFEITIQPSKTKAHHYQAYLGETLLCTSRLPFYDGARELLSLGYPPEAMVTMRHQGKAYPSFVPTTLGKAAKLTVIENDTDGPKVAKHQPNPFAEARREEQQVAA